MITTSLPTIHLPIPKVPALQTQRTYGQCSLRQSSSTSSISLFIINPWETLVPGRLYSLKTSQSASRSLSNVGRSIRRPFLDFILETPSILSNPIKMRRLKPKKRRWLAQRPLAQLKVEAEWDRRAPLSHPWCLLFALPKSSIALPISLSSHQSPRHLSLLHS